MMSIIGTIEKGITDTLVEINGTSATMPGYSTPYVFNTKTNSVNLRDETVAIVYDQLSGNVNYNIEIGDEQNTKLEIGQNWIRNELPIVITATLKNTEIGISKNLINEKMNLLIEDLKFIFWKNHTLYNSCSGIRLISILREYTKVNDLINGGQLKIRLIIDYSQFGSNPNLIYI